jgi:RHS repeat-associated protein
VYADEGLVAEVDAAGNVVKSYGYRPGSTWTTDPLFMKTEGQYYFYQNDHLGTPQKLTAANGAVAWSTKYSSFGRAEVDLFSTIENNLRFAGQYFDAETSLHYNWHRYYNVSVGRYTASDPLGILGGINPYIYSMNNPVNAFDPTGERSLRVKVLEKILVEIGIISGEKKHQKRLEEENEKRRRLIEEWSLKIKECYDLGRKILTQCDQACIQKFPTDDCNRQKCHMDCFYNDYLPHKRYCRSLEEQEKNLKQPIVEI